MGAGVPPAPGSLGAGSPGTAVQAGIGAGRQHGMLPESLRLRFVLLVSGLGLGSGSGESLLSTQLLVDVVTGQLGAEGQQSCAAQISRVILAGNLLSQNTQSRDTINKVRRGRGLQPRQCSPGLELAQGVPRR